MQQYVRARHFSLTVKNIFSALRCECCECRQLKRAAALEMYGFKRSSCNTESALTNSELLVRQSHQTSKRFPLLRSPKKDLSQECQKFSYTIAILIKACGR